MKRLGAALLVLGCGVLQAQPAPADDAQRCRTIADNQQRLACFDALQNPLPPAEQGAGTGAAKKPPPPPSPEYGQPPLRSRLIGPFKAWERGTVFKLENGQVWKASGDEHGFSPDVPDNPEVIVTTTYLGSFWLEVEPTGRKIKVRRIQ